MLDENKIFMRQILTITALIFSCSVNYAQISSGKVENKIEKPKKEKVKDSIQVTLNENWFYLGTGFQLNSRRLAEATTNFGKPLGIRLDEKAQNTWSFQLGVRNRVHNYLTIDGAIQYNRFEESYAYASTTSDSTYAYTRKYGFISVPIQGYLTFGTRLQFFIGGGFQAGIPIRLSLQTTFADSLGNETSTTIKKKETLNPFTFSLLSTLGVSYQFSNQWGMYVMPSFNYGLSNIYNKQQPHQQWLDGINVKFGVVFLPNGWKVPKFKKSTNLG
jgi:hypothetical protein